MSKRKKKTTKHKKFHVDMYEIGAFCFHAKKKPLAVKVLHHASYIGTWKKKQILELKEMVDDVLGGKSC